MKKLAFVLLAMVLVLTLGASAVLAAKGDNPANDNPNNLYLYEKDSSWDIVWDGAWGKMTWNRSGKVSFNGHGLTPDADYTLVIYSGWPNVTGIGSGTADEDGNIHISGSIAAGSYDKIWLVLSADITDDELNKWNPDPYLFEHNAITIP